MDIGKFYELRLAWIGRRIRRSYQSKENILSKTSNYFLREQLEAYKNKLGKHIYRSISELSVEAWVTKEPVSFAERKEGKYIKLMKGQSWGELFDCAWFYFTGRIPVSERGRAVVALIDISGEGAVVDAAGTPVIGITNVHSNYDYSLGLAGKKVVELTSCLEASQDVELWMDAGCNDLFGNLKDKGKVLQAEIAVINKEIWTLYYDFEVLLSLVDSMPPNDTRYANEIIKRLNDAVRIARSLHNEAARKAHEHLLPVLDSKSVDESLKVTAIGHAHLDLAWLWPIRETIRKGGRTFSTAINMMERYPDYRFGASQAQLYLWIKERYPELYEKIKVKVREGKLEVQGAAWVEFDTNISGGEALIRQVLYGKAFFMEEFGLDMKILWLPDTFGYSGALPQIMAKSGVPYFMTQKLSWNDTNKFPYHTFNWQGIDGSTVLAHLLPENTYNSPLTPYKVKFLQKNYKDNDVCDEALMLFGIGDGGGGPGAEYLERAKRITNLKGLPKVTQDLSLNMFYRINEKRDSYTTVPGELYLEKHQGTYTTQSRNKRYNRLMELALMQCEFALTLSEVLHKQDYSKNRLIGIWREVLLYQFHDILPGSSIKRVYDESLQRYQVLYEEVQKITNEAFQAIAASIKHNENEVIIFNPLSWYREEYIKYLDNWYKVSIPPMGYGLLDARRKVQSTLISIEDGVLENSLIKVTFNTDGTLHSVWDKEYKREALEAGKSANAFRLYKDDGDAWDIKPKDYFNRRSSKALLVSSECFTEGPTAYALQNYRIGESTISQKVMIYEGSKKIEFITKVEWKETKRMLRTSFPVNIKSDIAKYNIQFGHIERPATHENKIDKARYETSGHKWVDLSEKDYGVALLNNCKYGYRIWDNVLDMNLLRSPMYPGIDADKGIHEFTYVLYPHIGDLEHSDTYLEAYRLNVPLWIVKQETSVHDSLLPPEQSLIQIDSKQVIIENIKKSEDDQGYILRLYNSGSEISRANISFQHFKPESIVDLMENKLEQCESETNLNYSFKPFEILSVKLLAASQA